MITLGVKVDCHVHTDDFGQGYVTPVVIGTLDGKIEAVCDV
jgi:hypothetical protein